MAEKRQSRARTIETCVDGHLPVLGPGPAYVGTIVALTASTVTLSCLGTIPLASARAVAMPLGIFGVSLMLASIAPWIAANFLAKITKDIKKTY